MTSPTTEVGAAFTEDEYAKFAKSVRDCESHSNLTRISGRLDQHQMIKELGREKCDAMWNEFLKRNPEPKHDPS